MTVIVPNNSPYFEEKNERGAHTKLPDKLIDGKVFDMEMVDTSVSVEIVQSLLKLHLKQDVIIELFKCLEHNVMKRDEFSEQFSHALRKRQATIVASMSIQATKR